MSFMDDLIMEGFDFIELVAGINHPSTITIAPKEEVGIWTWVQQANLFGLRGYQVVQTDVVDRRITRMKAVKP